MEAFPTILLLTRDAVLTGAIPAQLMHTQAEECHVVDSWEALCQNLARHAPTLALLDCAEPMHDIAVLRQKHPLMGLIGIGSAEQAGIFTHLPLSAFIKRPLSMPALIHSVEHLNYNRSMSAGRQSLNIGPHALFLPADRIVRHTEGDIELTDKEAAILLCLYHHRQHPLPRQQLLEEVWGYSDSIATHTLETHLYRLRNKLREAFGDTEIIITQQGNYRLHP